MITQNTDGSQTIQASDLIEYSLDLQTLIKQGYAVQLSNDEAPILLGYMCVATLKKDEDNVPGTLNVTINVDSQSAIDKIIKIAQETGKHEMMAEQGDNVMEAVSKAISVESTQKKPAGRPKAVKGGV